MSLYLAPPARGARSGPGRLSAAALAGSTVAALSLFLSSLAYADAVPLRGEAGPVLALVQVSPGHLRRARLMRVEEPQQGTVEARAPSVAEAWPEPSLIRGAVMALVGLGCLWLAVGWRSVKPV
jgi:hypothetical protein